MEDLKTLKGEVDSIIFKSEDTGFCVLMLNCDNDLITVVGEMGDVEAVSYTHLEPTRRS